MHRGPIGLGKIATYAGIANSTAARWVTVLQQRGIVEWKQDPTIDLRLTQSGLDRVEAMLATAYEVPDEAIILA